MNRFKRTLIVAAMSVMTLSANAYPWLSPYAYCMNNPVKFVDPDGRFTTDYYGLNGKLYRHIEDGKTENRLILNNGRNKKKDTAINNGETIPVPSNAVVEQMAECYRRTEETGNETGFIVGVNGTVTSNVEGSPQGIGLQDWKTAQEELKSNNEYAAYDAHTHPKGSPEITGVYGSFKPSECDKGNVIGTYTGNHPNVVMGYEQKLVPSASLGAISSVGGQNNKYEYVRQIAWYNTSGIIGESIPFEEFYKATKTINGK